MPQIREPFDPFKSFSSRQWPVQETYADSPESRPLITRALNNDNLVDARKLVGLFRSHYGDEHPLTEVYDTNFWSRSSQSRLEPGGLVSMVALDGEEFVAHLALDSDIATGTLQVLLPAFHPEYRNRLFPIIREFWQQIQKTLDRQNGNLVLTYNITSQRMLQLLATKCFHSEPCALLPCSTRNGKPGSGAYSPLNSVAGILAMCHVPPDTVRQSKTLYAPPRHVQKLEEMFSKFGLKRIFSVSTPGSNRDITCCTPSSELLESTKPFTTAFTPRFLKHFGIYQLWVTPDALSDMDSTMAAVHRLENPANGRTRALVVQTPLDDPRCPTLCGQLEQIGYRFCGVFPRIGTCDFIAYARFEDPDFSALTLYSPGAEALHNYILQQTHLS